ncbi:hypothetical protein [Nonomuraea maheshkhaliensis]
MPEAIAALPRDRGYPVPWVSCWANGQFIVRNTPHSGLVRRCGCTPGQGRALIGTPCADRQRRAMRQRLCGTCGRPLTSPMVFIGERDMPYSQEPALHVECAVFSLRACPHLLHHGTSVGVIIASAYGIMESRVLGFDDRGNPIRRLCPAGDGKRTGGALECLIARMPQSALRHPAEAWLAATG